MLKKPLAPLGLPRPPAKQRAYFAGYFDAEGCVFVVSPRNTTWRARVMFGQVRAAVLLQLHAIYGGALRAVKRQRANWQPQTTWTLQRFGALACFLDDILPFVAEKRPQVEAVLTRFSAHMPPTEGQQLRADLARLKQHALTHAPPEAPPEAQQPATLLCPCGRRARTRGFCPKHYQRACREGMLQPRRGQRGRGLTPFNYRTVPTETDKAYAAGYFDGDGTVCLLRHSTGRSWSLVIHFNQTQPEGVQRLHAIYGGRLRLSRRPLPQRHVLVWRLTQRNAVLTFLHDLQPYLIEKRAEVDLLLTRYRPDLSAAEGAALLAAQRATRVPPPVKS